MSARPRPPLYVQQEDPEIVALENCRYDVELEISDDVTIEPAPNRVTRLPAMRVAELDLAGPIAHEMRDRLHLPDVVAVERLRPRAHDGAHECAEFE